MFREKNEQSFKLMRNFMYLRASAENTSNDFAVREALTWSACHKLRNTWSSQFPREIKIWLCLSIMEPVFLCGAETWVVTKSLTKQLYSCYARIFVMALNVSWKSYLPSNKL